MRSLTNPRAEDLSPQYDRLKRAIDRYETEIINPTISDILKEFCLQIGYILSLLICSILVNLKPNLLSVFGTIGLNGLGISANWDRLMKSVHKFQDDRRTLKNSVSLLRIELELCNNNDSACLNKVEALLRTYQSSHEA